jgi:YidC/Oxa1 family membrane protein insertase
VDRNSLLAIALSAILFFGWQAYLDHKYPNRGKPPPPAEVTQTAQEPPGSVDLAPITPQAQVATATSKAPMAPEQLVTIERPLYTASFSSRGAVLERWALHEYDDASRPGRPDVEITTTTTSHGALATPWSELGHGDLSALDYAVEPGPPDHATLAFTAAVGAVSVRKVYRFDPDGYGGRLAIEVVNGGSTPIAPTFELHWPAEIRPGADFVDFGLAAYADDKLHEFHVTPRPGFLGFGGKGDREAQQIAPKPGATPGEFELDWAAAQTRYFVAALIPDNPADARASLTPVVPEREARLAVSFAPVELPPGARLMREYRFYFGPKEPDRLDAAGAHLDQAIHRGWAPSLTRFFTSLLTATHRIVPNYGLAILLLTVVIRLAIAPLMATQMRSMKRMADLAPKISAVREKHAGDQQKQSEAMMRVYKDAGMNPLSSFTGCLPMLLQMPIVVGFYFALQGSIQLRQQPFFAWITDLSQPEALFVIPGIDLPVRVLPLLMGASMVFQQKMTPSTMDPAQARMMLIVMPVMFTVMFYQFASGLVLYWLMSTLLGIAQQMFMNRNRAPATAS